MKFIFAALLSIFAVAALNASAAPRCSNNWPGPRVCSLGRGVFVGYSTKSASHYQLRGEEVWRTIPVITGVDHWGYDNPCEAATSEAENAAIEACQNQFPRANCQAFRSLEPQLSDGGGCGATVYVRAGR